ncbi:MAG: hypothetical protein GXO66_01635 [Euryarchaeota archaeon]|nr:hypothetical protein [Euryarchaeota archaeon]
MSPRQLALASFVLLGIVDGVLTYLGVSIFGLVEGNLLMRALIEKGWFYFFALKVVVYALLAKASLYIYPRVAPAVLSAMGAGVVVHNFALIASSL